MNRPLRSRRTLRDRNNPDSKTRGAATLDALVRKRTKMIVEQSDKIGEWVGAHIKLEDQDEIDSDLIKF